MGVVLLVAGVLGFVVVRFVVWPPRRWARWRRRTRPIRRVLFPWRYDSLGHPRL